MRKALAFGVSAYFVSVPACADSCWNHNGSLMRLIASGDSRTFIYEVPRSGLASIGVRRGDVLFTGHATGTSYEGIARIFSTECPGETTQYGVSGPILPGEKQVILYGSRQTYRKCESTDRRVQDKLIFNYSHRC